MGNSSKDPAKPYGFVLVLRGLARAAIRLEHHPAALRALCVAAEYMNQDGECRISQGTIAARLGISRQAVNRHLALLDNMEILVGGAAKDGVTRRYALDMANLENEREGQHRVDARNAEKSSTPKPSKPKSFQTQQTTEPAQAEAKAGRLLRNEHLFEDRIGYPAFLQQDVSKGFAAAEAAMVAYEASQGVEYRINSKAAEGDPTTYRQVYLERRPFAVVAGRECDSANWAVSDMATHHKFGAGQVEAIDGNKITVRFDIGVRAVIASFLERATPDAAGAPPTAPFREPATLDVAGGAT